MWCYNLQREHLSPIQCHVARRSPLYILRSRSGRGLVSFQLGAIALMNITGIANMA